MLYFTSMHEYANADAVVPPPPQNVLIVADSTYTINADTKRQLPYGRESPNVAIKHHHSPPRGVQMGRRQRYYDLMAARQRACTGTGHGLCRWAERH
jgi:hypothetical protein